MRILAINGSHRKGKNTAFMLRIVLEEASKLGAQTELIDLADFRIERCQGCNKCLRNPTCTIQDDDMGLIAEKLLSAHGIVLGSPVYWGNVTGLMKNFMDRTRWMSMTRRMLAGKVGAAVTHAGLRNGGQELALLVMEYFLRSHGMVLAGATSESGPRFASGAMGTLFERIDGSTVSWKRSVEEDAVAVLACRQLGRNIADLIGRLHAQGRVGHPHDGVG